MGDDTWLVTGHKDPQLVRPDWTPAEPIGIEGVVAREVSNVLTDNGCLAEVWRADWELDDLGVAHVFQRTLDPGTVSAWHAHRVTTDRLFCATGRLRVALYDGRTTSPSSGRGATVRLGGERPAVVVVPPGVWHGVRNIGPGPALLLNAVDIAYDYEDPDHYRLPADTPQIPFNV